MSLELVLLIGLQASGKTTFYQKYFSQTHAHVSKDKMPHVRNRQARQERLITEALTQGRSVVVDNTNPTAFVRQPLIKLGHALHAQVIAYYFEPNIIMNLERNRQRAGRACVPDVAVYATHRRLELPSKKEGFDQCFKVCLLDSLQFEILPF